ncbi:MAG: translation initiation factor IF-2 subunit gamma [Candidatus Diapherotrites archaeon]|nr:translation initiation factor IF-2 subunit gamma [Candidatus Diapherotrites archaeon]
MKTFFSAEGTVNEKTRQLSLTQANRQSVYLIGYALKRFGISHSIHPIQKQATNGSRIKREYWQLIISDQKSLLKFNTRIGFELDEKQEKLERLCRIKGIGKTSDRMIPLNHKRLSELVELLGLKKTHAFNPSRTLKKQKWFFAYQDCRAKNSVSEEKLSEMKSFFHERLRQMETLKTDFVSRQLLSEWDISQAVLASESEVSIKRVQTALDNRGNSGIKNALCSALERLLAQRLKKANTVFEKIAANSPDSIEWTKIKHLRHSNYVGPIVDLQVPGYHNFICGTGGLISHNTSLTRALTGKWTDTFSEELKRGISIRLGYADAVFYQYAGASGAERFGTKAQGPNGDAGRVLRRVSFVDVPGHETLMTTMLSGACLMNGAVLVIAANEKCPQPSTAEHVMALRAIGVKHLVVAQNKVDLVEKAQAIKNHGEIVAFLKDTGFEDVPIIPVSANFNTNIDALVEALQLTVPSPKLDTTKALRMFVARSFDVNTPGTKPESLKGGVVGGSIMAGHVNVGDSIELVPGIDGKPVITQVVSLHTSFGPIQEAFAGGLIAFGTQMDPGVAKNDQLKGQLVGKPGTLPKPTDKLSLKLYLFKRIVETVDSQIHASETIVVTIGTTTVIGTVTRVSKDHLEAVLKSPVVVEKEQTVAISKRQKSGWRLVAYGTVA